MNSYVYNFCNGCPVGFKERNSLNYYKSHGEKADADSLAAISAIPELRVILTHYDEDNALHVN